MSDIKVPREAFVKNYDADRSDQVSGAEKKSAGELFDAVDVGGPKRGDGVVEDADFQALYKEKGAAGFKDAVEPFSKAAVRSAAHILTNHSDNPQRVALAKNLLQRVIQPINVEGKKVALAASRDLTNAKWNLGQVANTEKNWPEAARIFGEFASADPADTQAAYLEQQAYFKIAEEAYNPKPLEIEISGESVSSPNVQALSNKIDRAADMLQTVRSVGGEFMGVKAENLVSDIKNFVDEYNDLVDQAGRQGETPGGGVAKWRAATKAEMAERLSQILDPNS